MLCVHTTQRIGSPLQVTKFDSPATFQARGFASRPFGAVCPFACEDICLGGDESPCIIEDFPPFRTLSSADEEGTRSKTSVREWFLILIAHSQPGDHKVSSQ